MNETCKLLGYAYPLSVRRGDSIGFYFSGIGIDRAAIEVVRVRCADPIPSGPGIKVEPIATNISGQIELREQPIQAGSHMSVGALSRHSLSDLSFACHLFPTLPGSGVQTIASQWNETKAEGWSLEIDANGFLCMVAGIAGRVWVARAEQPLRAREWSFVSGGVDFENGCIAVHQISLERRNGRDTTSWAQTTGIGLRKWSLRQGLILAGKVAGRGVGCHFNGKIDRPRLFGAPLSVHELRSLVDVNSARECGVAVAIWDMSRGITTGHVEDVSGNGLHGTLVNMPMRGATGANWDQSSMSWSEVPEQYGAIHFHDDDMIDCAWQEDARLVIPSDWRSGFYAVRMTGKSRSGQPVEGYVSFFVSAKLGERQAKIAVIASTATYLAYANITSGFDDPLREVPQEGLIILRPDTVFLYDHRELGLSTYETHKDGSGCCFSAAKRPILNMQPPGDEFNYANDTHLIDWLEEKSISYDVVTDEELHREGASLIKPYALVITASHPEYVSRQMLDALEAYQSAGGRHMYLGGNGFYWRIAFHSEISGLIEVRRGHTGTRTWEGEPGELHLSFTGEPSGTWRSNGRAPQRLVGVGFAAQKFDGSVPYRRLPESYQAEAAFIFEGVDEEEIGAFGLRGDGAAGLEVDRTDVNLGSPPNIVRLATADNLGAGGMLAEEDIPISHRGTTGDQTSDARADMVFFKTAQGGAVFATGSIAWCCSLSHNHYDNPVSRITENVLKRFVDPTPL
ncbi:hypothetical protein AU467_20245 [Mesorhizobium loti]|uniref:N,N-dimethylformamidase beta subunit-like C-terminal domain-containing protein n=1 Tax=Rhizobium loti TaxID=381 RepID=A0A101KTG9_RHILI|nr:hypothetical protein AU467_20245 [Mesorhizobium loti]